ncbi:hypothetical protein ACFQMF_05660 [Halorubrum rutilum]|uniref:Uncharacterized protein n=1 Tax=Halorubrum rutilum TaxID=1364933 RepID=A0ABD6AIM3_9EURY|nr:hypothetical protein [Halorubrum rutilum]
MTDRSESSEPAVAANDDADDGDEPEEDGLEYLDEIEDGAGCTEVWEHLSERRETERRAAEREE